MSHHVGSSAHSFVTPAQMDLGHELAGLRMRARPDMGNRSISEEEIRINIHPAGTLARKNYILKLCKALMRYGAPTHRLEEYLDMSAHILEIEACFQYSPGCMMVTFQDRSAHTSEVEYVKTDQGVHLEKLEDAHTIYEDILNDKISVEEGTARLEDIFARGSNFNEWRMVPMYGLASMTVAPFAFHARFIDLPYCFLLGCLVRLLQLVAPENGYTDIGATLITCFIARALGSMRHEGGEIFCHSAIAQSSIALILPGFKLLMAAQEFEKKHPAVGADRLAGTGWYLLKIWYAITLGTGLYGMMDKNATSSTICHQPMPKSYYYLFVPAFAICLQIISHAKLRQMTSMTIIAFIGWLVVSHSTKYIHNDQVSSALGAMTIGIVANLHARFGVQIRNWTFGYGLAAVTMLPGIFLLVPGGLSIQGPFVSGLAIGDGVYNSVHGQRLLVSIAQDVAFQVLAIVLGISMGLSVAASIVWPRGIRSGVFTL
ncbi:DUF1212 domain membrane Prm10 [Pyrenophora seminiperda CCB06]|uniref:DUF1212 domain membrane Prm10 n=1 Tax=Pyrenophora seminiperda CCB06 TaxID=1302712 RepID=A0A3M7M2M0_9PLEO|nr:DUF1212 domain membrane Prm10 [Pyrenophora seminiperda CCB06]